MFATLENEDAIENHFLRLISGVHGFFSRCRCTVGGQLVQDLDQYNRHCELSYSFKSVNARHSDEFESAAQPRWDDDWKPIRYFFRSVCKIKRGWLSPDGNSDFRDHNAWADISNRYTRHSLTGIRGGESVRLGHKFKCGFLESNYYLPVRYAPLEIEVTLVRDQFTPMVQPVPTATASAQGGDRAGYFSQKVTPAHYGL